MTSNSLTENEEHDIPLQILKTMFELHASVFRPQYVCSTFVGSSDPNSSGQLAELIVILFHPNRSV